jgi:mRNA-degrading endonuclease toxin of MazEF toxin-antitoxin module
MASSAARGDIWLADLNPVRTISKDRLVTRWGTVSPATMSQVEDRLRILLHL